MLDLPFQIYSNKHHGIDGSLMDLLPNAREGRQGSGQIYMAVNTFTGNLHVKTTPLLIDDLGGPIDLSMCFNSCLPSAMPKWHFAFMSQLLSINNHSIVVLAQDGSEVTYKSTDNGQHYQAPKDSQHAGATIRKIHSGFEWQQPRTHIKRTYTSAGYLSTATNASGHTLHYEYSMFGSTLTRITSSSGRQYIFSWHNHECEISLLKAGHVHAKSLVKYLFLDNSLNQLKKITLMHDDSDKCYIVNFSYEKTSVHYNAVEMLAKISQQDGTITHCVLNQDGQVKKLGFNDNKTTYSFFSRSAPEVPTEPELRIGIKLDQMANGSVGYELIHNPDTGRYRKIAPLVITPQSETYCFECQTAAPHLLNSIIRQDGTYRQYSYHTNGKVRQISERDRDNNYLSSKIFSYDEQGSLITITEYLIPEDYRGNLEALPCQEQHYIYRYLEHGVRQLSYIVHADLSVEQFLYENSLIKSHTLYFSTLTEAENIDIDLLDAWYISLSAAQKKQAIFTEFKINDHGQVEMETVYEKLNELGLGSDISIKFRKSFSRSLTGAILNEGRHKSEQEILTEIYERDALDRVTKHTTVLNHTTTTQYQKNTIITTMPTGFKTTDSFDAWHHIISQIDSNKASLNHQYNSQGKLETLVSQDGRKNYYLYNDEGDLIIEMNGMGEITSHSQDKQRNTNKIVRFCHRFPINLGPINVDELMSFINQHQTDVENRIHFQIKDSLGRVRFEINRVDDAYNATVKEHRYNSLSEKIETIAYAHLFTPEQIGQIEQSGKMLADCISENDRHTFSMYKNGLVLATVDPAGYVTLKKYNGAKLIVEEQVLFQPLTLTEMQTLSFETSIEMLNTFLSDENREKSQDRRSLNYYNSAGLIAISVDPEGFVTSYDYNTFGKINSRRRYHLALDNPHLLQTDIEPALPSISSEDEYITYDYDNEERCTTETYVNDGYLISKAYDDLGNVTLTETKATECHYTGDCYRATKAFYNQKGELEATFNPLVASELKSIELDELLSEYNKDRLREALKNSHAEKIKRDSFGRIVATTNALNQETNYFYDNENRLKFTLSPRGAVTINIFNAFGETTEVKKSKTCLDVEMFLATVTSGNIDKLTKLIDEQGDIVQFISTKKKYNHQGLVCQLTDEEGFEQINQYNSFNELCQKTQVVDKKIDSVPEKILTTEYKRELRGLVVAETIKSQVGKQSTTLYKKYQHPKGICTSTHQQGAAEYLTEFDKLDREIKNRCVMMDLITGEQIVVTLNEKKWDAFSRCVEHRQHLSDDLTTVTTFLYDRALRKKTKIIDLIEEVSVYNVFGEVMVLRNPFGLEHRFEHSADGKVESEKAYWQEDDLRTLLQHSFNFAGQYVTTKELNGLVTRYKRDLDGNVTEKSYEIEGEAHQVETFDSNALCQTIRHTNRRKNTISYVRTDRGLVEDMIVDPEGLDIHHQALFNGLQQRTLETIYSLHFEQQFKTQFTQDCLGRSEGKIVDPDDLALVTKTKRDKAGNIIQETDANGASKYRVIDARGNVVLSISAGGVIQYSEYNLQNQVTYIRRYSNRMSQSDIETIFESAQVERLNASKNWSSVLPIIESYKSLDDKQVSNFYDKRGLKSHSIQHFYDHQQRQHMVYVKKYTHSATAKQLSVRSYSEVIGVDFKDELQVFSSSGEVREKIEQITYNPHSNQYEGKVIKYDNYSFGLIGNEAFVEYRPLTEWETKQSAWCFSKRDLHEKVPSLVNNNEADFCQFYFYDKGDNQVLAISPTGAVTENIFNRQGKIIHTIKYATLLPKTLMDRLKLDERRVLEAELNEGYHSFEDLIRSFAHQAPSQNQHTHFVFNEYNKPIYSVDAKGLVIGYGYDENHNKIFSVHFHTSLFLNVCDDLAAIDAHLKHEYTFSNMDNKGYVYRSEFDAADREMSETDPLGNQDRYQRNAADLIVKHIDRAGFATDYEFDGAKRQIKEIQPEASIAAIEVVGELDEAHLALQTVRRRVVNEQHFDKTTHVLKHVLDVGFDEREALSTYDLDGKFTGTMLENVDVDDAESNSVSLFDHPTQKAVLQTKRVMHPNGNPLVEINEKGACQFYIYDGLDNLAYQISASGLVTQYRRDVFGQPLISTEFTERLRFSEDEKAYFIENGITAHWLDLKVSDLSGRDDRLKCYRYSNAGVLLDTTSGMRQYFDPATGEFYAAQGMIKQTYDAFGRVVQRAVLVSKTSAKTVWQKFYFWYELGQRHPCIEAESFMSDAASADNLFKIMVTRYNVHDHPYKRCEYANPVVLEQNPLALNFSQMLTYIDAHCQSADDRIELFESNYAGKETDVSRLNCVNQKIDDNGFLIDEPVPPNNDLIAKSELKCGYGARGELFQKTNANGDSEYAFVDERGYTVATIGLPVITGLDANSKPIYAYPLTYYFNNAHGEAIGSKEFVVGASMVATLEPYVLPSPVAINDFEDFLVLMLRDKRGLEILKQEGTKQTGFTYNETKQKVRQRLRRLVDFASETKRAMDEKKIGYDLSDNPILELNSRDGVVITNHSSQQTFNHWHERTEKFYLDSPTIKSITKWSQGHAWFSHHDKDLATLEFTNMVNDVTMAVTAHDDDLAQFDTEQQAIDFIKFNRYNNNVLKDIKTYDFAHHVIKHERPATKQFRMRNTPIYIGSEFFSHDFMSLSWAASATDHYPEAVAFVRIINETENWTFIPESESKFGLLKPQKIQDRFVIPLTGLNDGDYTAQLFFFNPSDVDQNGYPIAASQSLCSLQHAFEFSSDPYLHLSTEGIDDLNISIRTKILNYDQNNYIYTIRFYLWDMLPEKYKHSVLHIKTDAYNFDSYLRPVDNYVDVKINAGAFFLVCFDRAHLSLILNNGSIMPLPNLGIMPYQYPQVDCAFKPKNIFFYPSLNMPITNLNRFFVGDVRTDFLIATKDGIGIGLVFEDKGQQGLIKLSKTELAHQPKNEDPYLLSPEIPQFKTNRVTHSRYDVFKNNIQFQNELGYVWQKKFNVKDKLLEMVDPEIDAFVAPADLGQGDLVYQQIQSQKITRYGYDKNYQPIGLVLGYKNNTDNVEVMRPATQYHRSPNGQLYLEKSPTGVIKNQLFRNALTLPTSVLAEGLTLPMTLLYQGKQVHEMIFSGVNVGAFMSNATVSYQLIYDEKTMELCGFGVPASTYDTGNTHHVCKTRRDDLGQIAAHQLPGGQIRLYEKDNLDNDLSITYQARGKSKVVANYNRHPFSGLILEHVYNGEKWIYYNTKINVLKSKQQIIRNPIFSRELILSPKSTNQRLLDIYFKETATLEKVSYSYVADLRKSCASDLKKTYQEYFHDDADNIIETTRRYQDGYDRVVASYDSVKHKRTENSQGKFSQIFQMDPYYNQVLSSFRLVTTGEKFLSIQLANSFDDGDKILRISAPASEIYNSLSRFIVHMPNEQQGGINHYSFNGALARQQLFNKALTFDYDTIGRASNISYYEVGARKLVKHLLYDVSGYIAHLLFDATGQANEILVSAAYVGSHANIYTQNRYSWRRNGNFMQEKFYDTLRSIYQSTSAICFEDGQTPSETEVYDYSPQHNGKAEIFYIQSQSFTVVSDAELVPVSYRAGKRNASPKDTTKYNHLVYFDHSVNSALLDTRSSGLFFVPGLTGEPNGIVIKNYFSSIDSISKIRLCDIQYYRNTTRQIDFHYHISTHILMGVHENYLGYVNTTSVEKDVYFYSMKEFYRPIYLPNTFNGEDVIQPIISSHGPFEGNYGKEKYNAIFDEIKRNAAYKASFKRTYGEFHPYADLCMNIADPINEQSIIDTALSSPVWQRLENGVNINDPMFDNLPFYQKAMLPFIANEKGDLPTGLVLAISQGMKTQLKMGAEANKSLALQKLLNISFPQPYIAPKSEKNSFLDIFISVVVAVAIVAVAPAAAGILFSVPAGTAATAAEIGVTAGLMDAGLNGAAYKAHLISHYNVLDSVAAGITAGIGAKLNLAGLAGQKMDLNKLKSFLTYAVTSNVTNQFSNIAQHKQQGFKIEGLLGAITTGLMRQMVGLPNMPANNFLQYEAQQVFQMAEDIMLVDFMSATINGYDLDMKSSLTRAITNHAANEVARFTELSIHAINEHAKEEKLKGHDNLPPSHRKSSRHTASSQEHFEEDNFKMATMAAEGFGMSANDNSFDTTHQFMQEFWAGMGLDFNPESGKVMDDHWGSHLHTSHVATPKISNHSRTLTGQHQKRVEQFSKANAQSGMTMFGHRYSQKQAMTDAVSYLEEKSPEKSLFLSKNSPADMIKSAALKFAKNTIVTKSTPIVKEAVEFTKMNIEVGTMVLAGAELKFGYEAMSLGSRAIVGKAMIGGAQGLVGSMAAGGDVYDNLVGTGIGASLGGAFSSDVIPALTKFSIVSMGAMSGFISNATGQLFTISRNPKEKNISLVSIGLSTWGGGLAGLMAKYGAAGITGGIVQSTVQIPIDVLGSHLGEDVNNAYR